MYCAPEVFDGQRYNTAVDVYSFAVTVFECVCGRRHTRKQFLSTRGTISEAVCWGWRPKPTYIVKETIPLVLDLLQECWRSEKSEVKGGLASLLAADVAKRPTFMEIVERLESMRPSSAQAISPTLNPSESSLMLQPDKFEAARERHRNSRKGFACFLSHHQETCADEARLVKQRLEHLLDAKVFLGGKCSADSTLPCTRLTPPPLSSSRRLRQHRHPRADHPRPRLGRARAPPVHGGALGPAVPD